MQFYRLVLVTTAILSIFERSLLRMISTILEWNFQESSTESKMAFQLCVLVPLLLSVIFHQPAEAVSDADIHRVIVAYNPAYDHCRGIDALSGVTAKAAADKSCKEAFEALDRLHYNICEKWRQAECRLVSPGDHQYQCSCQIPHRVRSSITKDIVIPFRDCAATLLSQELLAGVPPAPTTDFQQIDSNYDVALEWAAIQDVFSTPDLYTGSSDVVYTAGEASGLRVGYDPSGAGPSSSTYAPQGVYTASSAFTPFGVDTTMGVINEHGAGSSGTLAIPGPSGHPSTSYNPPSGADLPGPSRHRRTTSPRSSGTAIRGPSGHPSTSNPSSSSVTIPGPSGSQSTTDPSNAPVSQTNQMDAAQDESLLPFSCPVCTKPFRTLLELGDHMKDHQSDSPVTKKPEDGRHKCRQCGKSYSRRGVLLAHKKSHGTLETYCMFCNRSLSSKAGYKKHMKRRHSDFSAGDPAAAKTGPTAGGPETGRHPCSGCGKTFVNIRALRAHEISHKTKDTHCIYCNQTFSSKNGHRDHMKRQHPTMAAALLEAAKEKREAQKTEWCEICGKGFKKGKGLREHKKMHDGETKCPECGGTFSRISALKLHRKTMHNVADP